MKMNSVWYPVLESPRLTGPTPFVFFDQQLVLFRTEDGQPHAMQRSCPHRGFDLARGKVAGDFLVCPYHGWSFGAYGAGHSPGTPRLHCTAKSVAAAESHGFIWLRESGDQPLEESDAFKLLGVDGAKFCGAVLADFAGPIEVVIDNFNEIEHTGEVHGSFGYPTERMHEVEITWERLAQGKFFISSMGPQKPLGWWQRQFLKLSNNDYFYGTWTTTVAPSTSSYTNRWFTTKTKEVQRSFGLDLRIFYLPLTKQSTRLVAFVYTTNMVLFPILRLIFMHLIKREISYDQTIVAHLLDSTQALSGRRLGRFDAVLQELRKDQLAAAGAKVTS